MKVYPVIYSDYDGSHIVAIYTSKDSADECAEVNNEELGSAYPNRASYDVEEFELIGE